MLDQIRLAQESFSELENALTELGFDGVLYSFYPKPMYLNLKVQPVLLFSNSFNQFVSHYLEQDFGNRDFVLRLASEGRLSSIDWWDEINLGNVTEREKEVTVCARDDFGIYNGVSIPLTYGKFAIAGISIITTSKDISLFRSNIKKSFHKIQSLALLHHHKILSSKNDLQFFINPLLDLITPKKKMVLKQLIAGKSLTKIEHHYPISRRYAEKLLLQLREDFGGISTNELMYILGTTHIEEYL